MFNNNAENDANKNSTNISNSNDSTNNATISHPLQQSTRSPFSNLQNLFFGVEPDPGLHQSNDSHPADYLAPRFQPTYSFPPSVRPEPVSQQINHPLRPQSCPNVELTQTKPAVQASSSPQSDSEDDIVFRFGAASIDTPTPRTRLVSDFPITQPRCKFDSTYLHLVRDRNASLTDFNDTTGTLKARMHLDETMKHIKNIKAFLPSDNFFPTFTSTGDLPGSTFNAMQNDYSEFFGFPYTVSTKMVPLPGFNGRKHGRVGQLLVPTFVLETHSALLIPPDDNNSTHTLYLLPPGHFRPLGFFLDSSPVHFTKTGSMTLPSGEQWGKYLVTPGFFFYGQKISGIEKIGCLLFSRTAPSFMPLVRDYIKRELGNPGILMFMQKLDKKHMLLGAQVFVLTPNLKKLFEEGLSDPVLVSIARYHGKQLGISGYFFLKLYFYYFWKNWRRMHPGIQPGTTEIHTQLMLIFAYRLQLQVLKGYEGPAPPLELLREAIKNPMILYAERRNEHVLKGGRKRYRDPEHNWALMERPLPPSSLVYSHPEYRKKGVHAPLSPPPANKSYFEFKQ